MSKIKYVLVICFLFFFGCSTPGDIIPTLWGSSTRALQEAIPDGVTREYSMSYGESFDMVLAALKAIDANIFIKDRVGGVIVITGLTKESVFSQDPDTPFLLPEDSEPNSTELGFFFTEDAPDHVKISASSLAPGFLRKVSEKVFKKLDDRQREKTEKSDGLSKS